MPKAKLPAADAGATRGQDLLMAFAGAGVYPPARAAGWRIWCEPCRKWDTLSVRPSVPLFARQR